MMSADPLLLRDEERDPRPWWALELVKRLDAIEKQQRWQTAVMAAVTPAAAALGWVAAQLLAAG
jgi:hypothetical protein